MPIKSSNDKRSFYNFYADTGNLEKVPTSNDAGLTNAIHFYRLGSTDFSDAGTAGNRDLTMYNGSSEEVTGTPGVTVGNMPPGLTDSRAMLSSVGYTANWRTSNGAFDWQNTTAMVGFFCYPTGQLGNPSASNYWDVFWQKHVSRTYVLDWWMNYSGEKRYDIPNSDYNSRMTEDTTYGTGRPTLDTWNYVRFGKDGTNIRTEIYTWGGSSWTRTVDQQDSSPGWSSDGPDGSNANEYIEFWSASNNRGNQGYVSNMGFYHADNWDTNPPSS